MQFFKKHYEKLILGVTLLGFLGAAAWMYFGISSVEEDIQKTEEALVTKNKPAVFQPLNLSTNEQVLERLKDPVTLVLLGTNNLFNPVKWIRRPDGSLIKLAAGNEIGPAAVVINKLTPLPFVLAYEGVNGAGDNLRYQFGLTREADKNPAKRRKTTVYLTPGSKQEGLLLREVRGDKNDPEGFQIVLTDDNTVVNLVKGKEFSRVSGYSADLAYPPENQTFKPGLRREDKVQFAGETYNIVAITDRDVTLSAKSNGKNTTVRLRPAQ